jgi:hypothetical protein
VRTPKWSADILSASVRSTLNFSERIFLIVLFALARSGGQDVRDPFSAPRAFHLLLKVVN